MPAFLTRLLMASAVACLALLTVALALRRPDPANTTPPELTSVAYRSIRGPHGTRCSLSAAMGGESQFQAFFMGSEYLRTACCPEGMWFWMPSYSRDEFFFCPVGDIDRVGLSPMLRPSFAMCVSGLSDSDPRSEFDDAEYRVERRFNGGLVREQSYHYGGSPELTVTITERQELGGHSLPKSVSVNLHDGNPPFAFDMGDPEVNPPHMLGLTPPKGKVGSRLERVR